MASPVRTSAAALAASLWHALPGHGQEAEILGDPEALERAHRAYLRDGALQLTRPELEETRLEPSPPPDWLQALGRFLESLGPFFQAIFWIAVFLVSYNFV